MALPGTRIDRELRPLVKPVESIFDRLSWLYTIWRERLFQDDTESIVQILVSFGLTINGASLVELGCGPGFYATRIAQRFRLLNVIGVDRSLNLVKHSEARARLLQLSNCRFLYADVRELPIANGTVEAIITSRLFMILDDRRAAMNEVFRVLRPGGLFFIAEPLSQRRAMIPMTMMKGLAAVMRSIGSAEPNDYGEGTPVRVLQPGDFAKLCELHAWQRVVSWRTKHYQYAVCAKEGLKPPVRPELPDDFVI